MLPEQTHMKRIVSLAAIILLMLAPCVGKSTQTVAIIADVQTAGEARRSSAISGSVHSGQRQACLDERFRVTQHRVEQ